MGIKVWQNNVGRGRAEMNELLRRAGVEEVDVVLIQEP